MGFLGDDRAPSEGSVYPGRVTLRGTGKERSRQPGVAGTRPGQVMVSELEAVDESFGSAAAGAPPDPRKGRRLSNAKPPGVVGYRRFART